MPELRGICPVLPVPFLLNCEIDFASFDRVVDFALGAGVSALAVLGLGSESWKFTEAERGLIVEAIVRRVAGTVPVVAGVGAESARCAIQHAQQAERAGASILMVTPPLNFRLSEDAILDYYRAISDACELPIMIQDTSSVGVNQMPVGLIMRLATEIKNIKYAKIETLPAGPKISLLREQTGLVLFGGNGALNMLDALERGASGMMPGAEIADRFVEIWRLYCDGQVVEAAAAHKEILPLLALESQGAEAFVAIVKQVLYLRGVIASPMVRPPASYVVDNIAARQIAALVGELA
ncbi:MAG: dihydrodipicolinate synthase family protein [Bryobacteraceae bacterium]